MENIIKVLCVTEYFQPGYLGGGPITTLVNMRKQLRGQVILSIFTRDRDLGSKTAYSGVEVNQWLETPDGPIYYASPDNFGVRGVLQALNKRNFDVIYLNSFFSPYASILPYLALRQIRKRPHVLLAPRGEFSPGAISLKRLKKKFFLICARLIGLYADVFWHASTSMEVDDIQRVFPNSVGRIFIAADPVLNESFDCEVTIPKKVPGCLRLVFISRISPVKNIDGLIKILSTVSLPIQLDIFGPIEDEIYWKNCGEMISNLPENIQVKALGPISPGSVTRVFSQYDLFAFPTHGENFGHVIFEALRAGTPVLLSDQTPWQQDDAGALSVIPLWDKSGWREAIEKAANRTPVEHDHIRKVAKSYALRYIKESENSNENLTLFTNVISY